MNQRLTLQRLRALPRLETGLVVLLLVVAVVGYWQFKQISNARDAEMKLEQQLAKVRDDLAYLKANDSKSALRDKLEQLQSTPATPEAQAFPSRQEALGVGTAIVDYASKQDSYMISTFDVNTTSASLNDAEYPAIGYSIGARGKIDSLIETLRLAQSLPTATVQKLEFTRDSEAEGQWVMSLDLAVVYTEPMGRESGPGSGS